MFDVLDIDDQHEVLIALMKGLFGGGTSEPDVSQGSFNWLWLRTQAGATTDEHAHISASFNDLLPDTCAADVLARWGVIKGVPQKGATSASGTNVLQVTGTSGASVPDGATLTHVSGQVYEITQATVVGPGGTVLASIEALGVGSATSLNAGESLTFDATPSGLSGTALLVADLSNGTDAEAIGSWRARMLARFSNPPMGGTAADYVAWALEEIGIAVAYAYPIRAGYGTVDMTVLQAGSGTVRVPSAPQIAAAQAAIATLQPCMVLGFRVLPINENVQDTEFTVVTDGSLQTAFDWNDSTPAQVAAFNAVTRVLTFTTIPPDIQPGDRIVDANGVTGGQMVIETLGPGGNDVTLEYDPTYDTPSGGDTIYSGGPLVDPIRAAIQALFDSFGTANPDANPYGPWEGNLRPNAISRAATSVTGCKDGTVVAPAATVQANDPAGTLDDDIIDLILAGRILVHKQW